MLGDDPEVSASVVLEHLQRRGYEGRKTILKDYLKKVKTHLSIALGVQAARRRARPIARPKLRSISTGNYSRPALT
jgi:hypothetical protein